MHEEDLKSPGAKIRKWRRTKDVYVYFVNDIKTYAPFDAMRLMERCK